MCWNLGNQKHNRGKKSPNNFWIFLKKKPLQSCFCSGCLLNFICCHPLALITADCITWEVVVAEDPRQWLIPFCLKISSNLISLPSLHPPQATRDLLFVGLSIPTVSFPNYISVVQKRGIILDQQFYTAIFFGDTEMKTKPIGSPLSFGLVPPISFPKQLIRTPAWINWCCYQWPLACQELRSTSNPNLQCGIHLQRSSTD